ncbi:MULTISPECIES: iron uptake system protein EfeO [Brevibacillus]|uniref:iron uptake system protein EfeO n=1 Tax=Brevibacillus TaxID=55080 RepID=UPI000EE103D6|nr:MULTISPECIES: iron uptake system protein EfeO [Brevibacillus]MBU8713332.1 EfeM/EfeO family lipoprotein [Brevibacillus parabrevis]MED2255829.1 EfeM/EfeO family lipoprotein [Brevibacillus parabrevis]HBZ81562.1 EfeM/EfeO family lipoprotein [Brevibacillus sp.]
MMKKWGYPLSAVVLGSSLMLSACGSAETPKEEKKPEATQPATPAATETPAATTAVDLKAPIDDYRKWVIEQTDQLVKATESFTAAVKAGDMEKAKKEYAPARAYFERIEPIAESLGDFDPWIDAREGDVPDNEWRGYHKLEKALWETKSVADSGAVADQLLQDVKQLRVKVESVEIDVKMLVTGAVELLNEVSTSKVTGEEERYSHTDLYDFAANVEGANEIFKVLKPAVDAKDAALSKEIETRFAELDAALAPYRKDGGYVLYTELKPDEVKKLSQALDALAEPLSKMGTIIGG